MLAWLGAWGLARWGPPELGGRKVPDEDSEINWLLDAPWAKVALLITIAVGVLVLTNVLMRSKRKAKGLRRRPDFDLRVAKLEELPVVTIAAAKPGPVHLIGTLRIGDGALGTGERACVFQNRAGSSRATAIAAELVLLEDETGLIGLEQLDAARVIAPREEDGPHDTIALYLGDRVEVVGDLMLFDDPQIVGTQRLRGMLGSLGQFQVRVVERPADEPSEARATPEPSPADVDSRDSASATSDSSELS